MQTLSATVLSLDLPGMLHFQSWQYMHQFSFISWHLFLLLLNWCNAPYPVFVLIVKLLQIRSGLDHTNHPIILASLEVGMLDKLVWFCQAATGFTSTLSPFQRLCSMNRSAKMRSVNIKYASRSSAWASGWNLYKWLMCCCDGKQLDWSLIMISAPLAINTSKEPSRGLLHTPGLNWEWGSISLCVWVFGDGVGEGCCIIPIWSAKGCYSLTAGMTEYVSGFRCRGIHKVWRYSGLYLSHSLTTLGNNAADKSITFSPAGSYIYTYIYIYIYVWFYQKLT